MPDRTLPHPHPTGYQLWHGAQGWDGALEVRPCRKGSYEHGPGLYLTTRLDTAKHYGKGAGCLIEFELAPDTRFLENATLEWADVEAFLRGRPGLRHRDALLADLRQHLARRQERDPDLTTIWAPALVNVCVNHAVLTADHGPALAAFLVDHGIDASHANNRYNECWVVLFNPKVVTRTVRHRVATVDPHADFPNLEAQRQRIAAAAQGPVTASESGPSPVRSTRPRMRR